MKPIKCKHTGSTNRYEIHTGKDGDNIILAYNPHSDGGFIFSKADAVKLSAMLFESAFEELKV